MIHVHCKLYIVQAQYLSQFSANILAGITKKFKPRFSKKTNFRADLKNRDWDLSY